MIARLKKAIGLDVTKKTKEGYYSLARFACFKRLHDFGYGKSEIGRMFGFKHASVNYGINKIEDLLSINDEMAVRFWDRVKDVKLYD